MAPIQQAGRYAVQNRQEIEDIGFDDLAPRGFDN
jgi:hypothetical protein